MPELNWIGKKHVLNLDQQVPYRMIHCDSGLSIGDVSEGNLLIEGDNLEALKALLPYYGGKVKCIYIDPPYNTGNESWVYNDNVTAPEMKAWLGKAVGDELMDRTRHDKWLCMMMPRLKLLNSLLKDDGVIFVSIDSNEAFHLRLLLNEVFGSNNFIAELVWEKSRKNDARLFSVGHEYIFVYAKSLETIRGANTIWREPKPGAKEVIDQYRLLRAAYEDNKSVEHHLKEWFKSLPLTHPAKKLSRYKQVDDNGPWRDSDISWPGGNGPKYDVVHPVTQMPCAVPERGWIFSTHQLMMRHIASGMVVFREDHTSPPLRKSHLIPLPEEINEDVPDDEQDDDAVGLQVMPSVIYKQAQVAVKYLRKLMGDNVFENPKDHEIITRLIKYCTSSSNGDIILDSFAGSGTTGHSVLQLNAEDNGNRRFVLVELDPKICKTVTAERLKKVVEQNTTALLSSGGFRYCTLDAALLDGDNQINPDVKFSDLAHHVYFTETGEPLAYHPSSECNLIGVHNNIGYYLLWKSITEESILDLDTIRQLAPHDGLRVIYADGTTIPDDRLRKANIIFKQVPYQVRVR